MNSLSVLPHHPRRQLHAFQYDTRLPSQDYIQRPNSHATSRSTSPALTMSSTVPSSSARDSTSSCTTDFDDLYDVSDDDSAIVPLKCSNSIKALLARAEIRRESLPSLVIPSPTAWPTIQKLQKSATAPRSPVSYPKSCLSPAALARLNTTSLRVPTVNSTPSLDGSLTSDEIASMSPATPDLRCKTSEEDWDMPVQLDPQAMETLQHIAFGFNSDLGPIIEVPETQANEMQERGLNIDMAVPLQNNKESQPVPSSEPVSAISVPSPGGFLASLDSTSQRMWNLLQHMNPPSTTTAECFYDVPWNNHIHNSSRVVEQVIDHDADQESEGPPTARQNTFPAKVEMQTSPAREEQRPSDYDDEYEKKLNQTAASNMSRTSLWLAAQDTYLSALKETNPLNAEEPSPSLVSSRVDQGIKPDKSPATSNSSSPPTQHDALPSKKSVRFIESSAKTPVTAVHAPQDSRSDSLFYHAFQHLAQTARPSDAFGLRHVRADAIQAQRLYLPEVHRAQLRGQYSLSTPQEPSKDFAHLLDAPTDPAVQKHREAVAQADRERQALAQISLTHWHLEASRMLSSGSLLPRTAKDCLRAAEQAGRTPRVLDLGGLPTADWGWALSMEERHAKVYTAVITPTSSPTSWTVHRAPSNHRTLSVSHPWSLPFPSGSFDVVSARSLHALCRTRKVSPDTVGSPTAQASELPFAADFGNGQRQSHQPSDRASAALKAKDEYAATLAELYRVLAPNGALHYTLLDAEISTTTASASSHIAHSSTSTSTSSSTSNSNSVSSNSTTTATTAPPTSSTTPLTTLSKTFATSLLTAGYDPSAGHRSTTRLITAGFESSNIHENWVELPVGGQGSHRVGLVRESDEVADVTEVVGGVGYERWMLAVSDVSSMGSGAGGELKGVAGALEKARKASERVAWRMLVGVARKAEKEKTTSRVDKATAFGLTWI